MDQVTAEILARLKGTMTARVLNKGIELRVFMPFNEQKKVKLQKVQKIPEEGALVAARLLMAQAVQYLPPYKDKEAQIKAGTQWALDIEKMHRIDGIDYIAIQNIVKWLENDGFWYNKILSGKKLRQQYPKLYVAYGEWQMKNNVQDV